MSGIGIGRYWEGGREGPDHLDVFERCQARRCPRATRPDRAFCDRHWSMLPESARAELSGVVPRLAFFAAVTPVNLRAIEALAGAIEALARREGHFEANIYRMRARRWCEKLAEEGPQESRSGVAGGIGGGFHRGGRGGRRGGVGRGIMTTVMIAILGVSLYLGSGAVFVLAAALLLRRQDRSWQEGYQEGWETRKVYDRERSAAVAAGVLGRDRVRGIDADDCRWN